MLRFQKVLLVAVCAAFVGCGGDSDEARRDSPPPVAPQATAEQKDTQGQDGASTVVAQGAVTKNTSRLAASTPVEAAAAVALATFPSGSKLRPAAVAIADSSDWRAAISAAALMSAPVRAPLLLSEGGQLPSVAAEALKTLDPGGSKELGGPAVVLVGAGAASPADRKPYKAISRDPAGTGAAVDRALARANGGRSRAVIVAASEQDSAAYAMPAAGLAAKTGAPVLWTSRDTLPVATRRAIETRKRPRIYVVGPEKAVAESVMQSLRGLGTVTRIGAEDPAANSVAVTRYSDDSFGWGVVEPGHGLVFVPTQNPVLAGAAAALSTTGSYGPQLVLMERGVLPQPVEQFLLDIQPGYDSDPARAVYNHGWLIGGYETIGPDIQSRIDELLEVQPVGG